jgi:beta-1,4-N-acetylglucosaminyltransferase
MFKVLDSMRRQRYQPRVYVAAATDQLALTKVQQHEQRWAAADEAAAGKRLASQTSVSSRAPCTLRVIPRSREVRQSWVTSAVTTLWAALFSLRLLLLDRPQLLLANGPGTCLPLCLLARTLRLMSLLNCKVVFVESIARTQKLSMTGAILHKLHASDLFFVQWEQLQDRCPGAIYAGRVY